VWTVAEGFRCFVAVAIEPAVKAFLASWVRTAGEAFPGYRFGPAQNLHVTLQFLGDVDRGLMLRLTDLLSSSVRDLPAFRAGLGHAGSFPERGTPRILHVAVDQGRGDLVRVAERVRSALSSAGFEPDKPFAAHITLGRSRDSRQGGRSKDKDLAALWRDLYAEFSRKAPAPAWEVAEVLLMESILGPSGPAYVARGKAPLRAPKGTPGHAENVP
jgi:2'-5' RNA ligase